jgi:hypothetical protein
MTSCYEDDGLMDAMPCGLVEAYVRLCLSTKYCILKTESEFSSETYVFYHTIRNDSQQTVSR